MTSQYVHLVLALPALRSRTTRAKSQSWNFSNVSAKREASESAKREITTQDVQYDIEQKEHILYPTTREYMVVPTNSLPNKCLSVLSKDKVRLIVVT